jgi:hypothetical protein
MYETTCPDMKLHTTKSTLVKQFEKNKQEIGLGSHLVADDELDHVVYGLGDEHPGVAFMKHFRQKFTDKNL